MVLKILQSCLSVEAMFPFRNILFPTDFSAHSQAALKYAAGFALAMAGTAAAQVKLAVGGPLTGPSAATGAQMKQGVDQAALRRRTAHGRHITRCRKH